MTVSAISIAPSRVSERHQLRFPGYGTLRASTRERVSDGSGMKKILIVEDDLMVADLLEEVLHPARISRSVALPEALRMPSR